MHHLFPTTSKAILGILGFLFFIGLAPILGQIPSFSEPYSNVIFSYSLQDFHEMLRTGTDEQLSQENLYLLGGTITSLAILDPEPQSYYVDLELMDAHWIDSRTLVNYEAYIVILDYRFASRVSTTGQNRPGMLAPQTRGLFLLQYYGPTESSTGELAPVFILVDFKPF